MTEQVPGIAQGKGGLWWHEKEQKFTVFTAARAARAPELVQVSILTLQRKKLRIPNHPQKKYNKKA